MPWLTDGSPELKVSHENELQIQCSNQRSSGELFNSAYHDPNQNITLGKHYWRLTLNYEDSKENPIWVGVTDLGKLKQGWAFRGLIFGGPGNLSNGGTLLVSRYGPKFKSGDIVGLLVKIDSSKLEIVFDVNGENLGKAFDLDRNVLAEIIPAIRFTGGNGSVTIQKVPSDQIPKYATTDKEAKSKVSGAWKLSSLKGMEKLESVETMMTLNEIPNESPNTYSVNLRIINNINFQLALEQVQSVNGKWSHTHLRSTRVAGSPEEMKYETEIKELVTSPDLLKVSKEGNLLVHNKSYESIWLRNVSQKTVIQNPFI